MIKGKVKVDSAMLVSFTIGKYQDDVLCDMIPNLDIFSCEPWKYERRVTNDGFRNRYNFVKDDRNINLLPLTPKEVFKDQLGMKKIKKEKEKESEPKKNSGKIKKKEEEKT